MDESKMTTDRLRGMLDTFSSEQQMEIDAQAIRESAEALSEVASKIETYTGVLSGLVNEMQKATVLHISEESIAAVVNTGDEIGKTVAEAFKNNVSDTIRDARRSVRHVSCPAIMALVLFSIFISLTLFAGIVIFLNYGFLDNDSIWKAAWISVGTFIFMMALTAFMRYMEWL